MKDNLSDIKNQLLVMDAQDGDVKAMEKLVSRWQKRLWQHAFRLTADQQAAWDITQQSWLGVIKGLRKLRDPANFKAWAYKIATNKSIDWLKKKSKDGQINLDSVEVDCYEKKDDLGITELIQKLKDESKVVLSLYYFEQLNISEISVVLNIPQGTVKSRLHGARKELKELWQRHFE
ncbi:MAG: RNA polymerase sigma factor [Planctomycetota bacterium]|jgi:RNA polymerase sigma-70 factor (ECF subfamily)